MQTMSVKLKEENKMSFYIKPEIQSEIAEDRKAGDMVIFYEICEEGLGITLKSEDTEQMYRLGKKDQNKVRPLLVKCVDSAEGISSVFIKEISGEVPEAVWMENGAPVILYFYK